MKKIGKLITIISITIISLFLLKQIVPILKLDGYEGLLLSAMLNEETKYSENYSNEKFLNINIGMTKEEVIKILGNPIIEWKPNENIDALQYSESPNSTHYRLRQVYLTKNNVVEKISYFYVD